MTKSKETMVAVFRNGHRVSETEYPSASFAEKELDHWKNIVKKYPDGSKLEILPVVPPRN
jgi:hypothetical protein